MASNIHTRYLYSAWLTCVHWGWDATGSFIVYAASNVQSFNNWSVVIRAERTTGSKTHHTMELDVWGNTGRDNLPSLPFWENTEITFPLYHSSPDCKPKLRSVTRHSGGEAEDLSSKPVWTSQSLKTVWAMARPRFRTEQINPWQDKSKNPPDKTPKLYISIFKRAISLHEIITR